MTLQNNTSQNCDKTVINSGSLFKQNITNGCDNFTVIK